MLEAILCGPAAADKIVLPAPALERNRPVDVTYRLDRPGTGHGALDILWTDGFGRTIERRKLAFQLVASTEVHFGLDLARAVAMQNQLQVHLVFEGVSQRDHREAETNASFIARPPADPWSDYQIIMWQWRTAAQYRALQQIGVTAGEAHVPYKDAPAQGLDDEIAPLLQSDLRWYVENIATDFYAAYHRWFPDRTPDARFLALQQLYRTNPTDPSLFIRDPSLSDPTWLKRVQIRLMRTVKAHEAYRPLFYNLADESGIADLSAQWDFDFSSASLAEFRRWLHTQYGSLAALNRQWNTGFARWDDVLPMTTSRALRQRDGNFSAWADFKAWMDIAFARALRVGSDAVHAADPAALAAIEGGQVPGTGGYDYAELAHAVDAMELYDEGDNMEIARSLSPALIMLNTSTEAGADAALETWRELFRGSRGVVLWDDKSAFVADDGTLEARGEAAAPLFAELESGLGALIINSRRHTDPIAMLYSPASLRTRWMLDNQPLGDAWSRREIGAETETNAIRASINQFARAIEHLGLQQKFIASAQLLDGTLEREGFHVLILPQVIALSPVEATAIRSFVSGGGTVIADSEPGQFDAHSRRLPSPLLEDIFAPAVGRRKAIRFAVDHADHAAAADPVLMQRLAAIFAAAGIEPNYRLSGLAGEPITDVETYQFSDGGTTILALLGDAPPAGKTRSAGEREVVLHLPQQAYLYDLRAHAALAQANHLALRLEPFQPRILAVSERPMPAPTVAVPKNALRGETTVLKLGFAGAPVAATDVLRLEIIDPAGHLAPYYSQKLRLRGAAIQVALPFALNDPAGNWTIRATDALSGQTASAVLTVLDR